MAQTQIRGTQVEDGTIQRRDLNVSTVGQAVVAKLLQGTNITLSSTGADSGTGDVTVSNPNGGLIGFLSKTSAYTIVSADRGQYFICSGGSWTLTLPAAAVGFFFQVRNDMGISGTTGTITLTPPAGTINGFASIPLLPQQDCTVVSDGANWRTVGLQRHVVLGTVDLASAVADSGVILLPAGFRYFELKWAGLVGSADNTLLCLQVSSNGGSAWLSSYDRAVISDTSATAVGYTSAFTEATGYIGQLTTAAISTVNNQTEITLYPGTAATAPRWQSRSSSYTQANNRISTYNVNGAYHGVGPVNAVHFYASSGNIGPGYLTVKGIV